MMWLKISLIVAGILVTGIGFALTARATSDWRLLSRGDAEAIAICVDDPHMDCNPLYWKQILLAGLCATALGMGLILSSKRSKPVV